MPEKISAQLNLYGADTWTPEGRRRIATWLRRQANFIVKQGDEIAPKFRARYISIEPENDPGEGEPIPLKEAA